MRPRSLLCTLLAAALLGLLPGLLSGTLCQGRVLAGEPWDAAAMDWPHWRGPEMNGISREKNLPDEWSPDGENLLWKSEELGGRSTPVVMDGLLYTIVRDQPGTPQEGEKVVCVDAATGEKKWEVRTNAFLTDVPDTRLGWSSVIADPVSKKVFALGVQDYFQCLDAKTGEVEWARSLSEEYGMLNTYGGRTNFPITYKNLVIVSGVVIGWGDMAKPAHRFIAFDQRNGQAVWFEGTRPLPEDTTYSAPVLAAFEGEAAMVFGSGDGGVHAFQPETGQKIWTYNVSARGINTTPVVAGDLVVCGHSEENLDTTKMGALFCIDGTKEGDITKTGEVWRQTEWFVGKSTPIVVDGRVYACEDTGTLVVADLKTGEKIQELRLGGPMRSSPIYADGKIYLMTENGRWWVLKPTEDGVENVVRGSRMDVGGSYGSPIVSHGRMYIPTTDALFCIGLEGAEPEADERPEPPEIAPVGEDETPAQARIVPVESLLRPGQKQSYQVRLYNANGQFLGLAFDSDQKVQFTAEGPGSVSADGTYSVPKDAGVSAASVTAKLGDISHTARVRIIPNFPWEFTFDDGTIPEPWIGIRYRHIPLDFELLEELKADDPLAAALYIAVQTGFVNNDAPAVTYDNSTPRQTWTEFLRYLKLLGKVQTLDESQAALDPALERLKEEGVLAGWQWGTWKKQFGDAELSGPQLKVQKGSHEIADGNGVMVKIQTIPKGQRSQGWIGNVNSANYTIQADVRGAGPQERLPDIGLVAQRYTMDLQGAAQKLQIRTWPPQLYMAKTIDFPWKADTWYVMKFQAAVEGEKAVLRGKVWERGTPEPTDWQIEATDDIPNRIGSPGFFGNAKDAEVFYDNVKVYSNDATKAAE